MAGQPFRGDEGGLIDRERPIAFTFNGERLQGYAGDTLASALLANGIRLVGRSFKYHRPRGIVSAGAEEPNALVQLAVGARTEPNARATQVELFEGLEAESQNCWPGVGFDVGALNGVFSSLFPAGFYYKTFMWPASLWMTYEHWIRKMAGLGRAPVQPDPDRYEHRFAHCDVLVAGGGPAGLAAALAAARSGARVILADEGADFGGALRGLRATIEGRPAMNWVRAAVAELAAMPDVVLLRRATVAGYYDHNSFVVSERPAEHMAVPAPFQARGRLWSVRAKEAVLATGAIERPLVFGNNDRPGVMLASAAQAYANRFAVRPGSRAVVFTNNDSAYEAALDLARAGVSVAAVIDAREDPGPAARRVREAGIESIPGHAVINVQGGRKLKAAEVMAINGDGTACAGGDWRAIPCDLLAVSGGWNPAVHLFSQSRGKLRFDDRIAALVPGESFQRERSAGAARGTFTLRGCLAEGFRAGAVAARAAGFDKAGEPPVPDCDTQAETPLRPLWVVPLPKHTRLKRFVDLQNDVTAEDVALALREGYDNVEHLKRYTTLGMGTDQGRTSNVSGLGILAGLRGKSIPSLGTTTFRPPYTAIPFGTIAGREIGHHFAPTRRSAMHAWHEQAGASFIPAGLWFRPQVYRRPGEGMMDAIYRETKSVRTTVGMIDVSTLGKIDIQGRDAALFLDRVYTNNFRKLPVGKARYGLMLREDGMVFDDGTTTRIGESRYLMTTTTARAGEVMRHLEYCLQVLWPELDAYAVSVTEEWAAIALAGPASRSVLERVVGGVDVSNEGLPYMGYREGTVAEVPARIFRISFSGELAYEINVPADYGAAVWEAIHTAGRSFDIIPYGTEALSILRIEKGHVVSGELNGRTTADDLGFSAFLSKEKDFIGKRSLAREGLWRPDRKQLVGLIPVDKKTRVPRGAQIVEDPDRETPVPMLGEITSQCYSPNLGHPIALGIVAGGRALHGRTLHALSPVTGERVPVTVTPNVFIDPKGERLRG
ncbi:MAG: sarcosine oxidase subunit alpha family protein [Rhodospirillales bacterium]|nr:sarcosine oxidase subunit alpha family protein [Rhodospirillales bacterium]